MTYLRSHSLSMGELSAYHEGALGCDQTLFPGNTQCDVGGGVTGQDCRVTVSPLSLTNCPRRQETAVGIRFCCSFTG